MNLIDLKPHLWKVFEQNYDMTDEYTINGREFEFYAKFNQRNAKYLASKKLEYYAFSTYDHLFFKKIDAVTPEVLTDLYNLTLEMVDFYSNVDDEHMETLITFVIQSNTELSDHAIKAVKKLNYVKNFSFGLKGWTKLKLIILVPTSNEVYTNKFGNRDKKSFQKILTKILNT